MKEYFFQDLICEDIFEKELFGYWILFQKHTELCNCSYCKEIFNNKKIIDFSKGIGKHHWTIICWKWKNKYYLRWAK